jgi:glycosyltransferase involved in cell wall biosynthesis
MAQTLQDFEIVIVNDGSSDTFTRQLLAGYHREKTTILHTNNQGLAAARNNGISRATGKYILPLDADDRIGPQYFEKAVSVLESSPDTGIVYCRARLFGAVETDWNLPEYSLAEMLQDNIIFCTAMFRRSDWELVGGYDSGMVYGWEDYDFWLSLIERRRGVCQIPEALFYYRVASDSMVRSKEKWQKVAMFKRIFARHQELFARNIEIWIDRLLTAREKYYTSRLYIDVGNGVSDQSSVGRKIENGTRMIDFQVSGFRNIQAVRFDPVDSFTVVEIGEILLETDAGLIELAPEQITSNACLQENSTFYFDTFDPQMFFNCEQATLGTLKRIRVHLTFIAIGEDALARIIDRLHREVETLRGGRTMVKPMLPKVLRSLLQD